MGNLKLDNLYWGTRKGVPTRKAQPVQLFKDGEILNFPTMTDARLFLKVGKCSFLKDAAKEDRPLKGYNVKFIETR